MRRCYDVWKFLNFRNLSDFWGNSYRFLASIFAKSSIIDVWWCSKYASGWGRSKRHATLRPKCLSNLTLMGKLSQSYIFQLCLEQELHVTTCNTPYSKCFASNICSYLLHVATCNDFFKRSQVMGSLKIRGKTCTHTISKHTERERKTLTQRHNDKNDEKNKKNSKVLGSSSI